MPYVKEICMPRKPDPEKRKEKWKKSLIKGRQDARLRPTALALARLQQGYMQWQIAEKTDMSLPTYCSVERGKRNVKTLQAKIIAKLLKEDFDKLFKKTDKSKWIARMPGEDWQSEIKATQPIEQGEILNVD
jgi:DNA-binding XRE family transcriptional regulator